MQIEQEIHQWGSVRHSFQIDRITGDIFHSADSVLLLSAKCAALIVARPLHTLALAAQLLFLELPKRLWAILSTIQEKKPLQVAQELWNTLWHVLGLVVLRLLGGLLLTVLATAGLLLGCTGSQAIYSIRTFAGKMEQFLVQQEISSKEKWYRSERILAACFLSYARQAALEQEYGQKTFKDTTYGEGQTKGWTNLVRFLHKNDG